MRSAYLLALIDLGQGSYSSRNSSVNTGELEGINPLAETDPNTKLFCNMV